MTRDGDDRADMTPLRRTRAEFDWKVSELIAVLRRCAPQAGVTLGSASPPRDGSICRSSGRCSSRCTRSGYSNRRLGAPSLLEQTRSVMATLAELLSYSLNPSVRESLAAVLADAGALAAWQALDVDAVQQAWAHYEIAKTAAREAESPVLLVHAMGEQAYALHDLGRLTDALSLVRQARTGAGKSCPSLLLCWLHAVDAEVQAV